MKTRLTGPLAVTMIAAGTFMIPTAMKAEDPPDSSEITQMLTEVKSEAAQLKDDSADLKTFAASNLTWQSHAAKIEMIKGHINKAGGLLEKLQAAKDNGSPWQQTAIDRIEPLLKDMADNLTATINHLNANQSKVHFNEFKDYVNANYEMATDLESLVRDFVDYGKAKATFERLGRKLEIG